MDEDASQVIAEHETITVENSVFDKFIVACNKAENPNKALLEAVAFTNASGFK
jgi:uncharacterized protein (DUF1778 family)